MNYTAVWDEVVWDTFFDDFNNLTLELQKIYIYYHLSFIYYFSLNIRHGLLKYVDICKYSNNHITMVTCTKNYFFVYRMGHVFDHHFFAYQVKPIYIFEYQNSVLKSRSKHRFFDTKFGNIR